MHPTLVSLRSALSTLLMPSASHSCARLIPGRLRTNASTLCATVAMASNVYSLASAPSNGTRRGLTRVLDTRQKPESSDSGLTRMATRCPRAEALAAAIGQNIEGTHDSCRVALAGLE
jgi:hypothetical protein